MRRPAGRPDVGYCSSGTLKESRTWPRCGTLAQMRVASLRLRLLAAMVDAAVMIGGMAVLVGLGIAGVVGYARICADEDEEDEPSDSDGTTRELPRSPQLRAALWGASAGLAVAGRNWRGPGFRVVGLRRVDAQTGGVVSVRSALIGVLFDQARQAATRRLFGSRAKRQRAVSGLNFAGWGWLLAAPVVSQLSLGVGSRGGRTVRDWITGTSVIMDR